MVARFKPCVGKQNKYMNRFNESETQEEESIILYDVACIVLTIANTWAQVQSLLVVLCSFQIWRHRKEHIRN